MTTMANRGSSSHPVAAAPPRPSRRHRIRSLIPHCAIIFLAGGGGTITHRRRDGRGTPHRVGPSPTKRYHSARLFTGAAAAFAAPSPISPTGRRSLGHGRGDVRCGAKSASAGRWIDLTDSSARIAPPRSGHVAFRTPGPDGDAFVFGGYAEDPPPPGADADPSVPPNRYVVNDLWRWSSSTSPTVGWVNTEQQSGSAPPPRLASAAAICGDRPTLFGGWDPQTPGTGGIILDTVHQITDTDPTSMEWDLLENVKIPDGPTSRHVAVPISSDDLGAGGRVLVHNHRCTDHVLVFSQTPGEASESSEPTPTGRMVKRPTTGAAPSPRGLHVGASLNGGRHVAIFGGAAQSGDMVNDAFLLDVTNWTWRELRCGDGGVGPTPRAGACCCPMRDGRSVLLFGGAEQVPGGGLHARGDLWRLRVDDFDGGEARWELLVDDDDEDGGDGGVVVVRPPRRNAATLTPIDPVADEEGEGAADAEYFVLQGGWDPFKVTFNDNYVLRVSSSP